MFSSLIDGTEQWNHILSPESELKMIYTPLQLSTGNVIFSIQVCAIMKCQDWHLQQWENMKSEKLKTVFAEYCEL